MQLPLLPIRMYSRSVSVSALLAITTAVARLSIFQQLMPLLLLRSLSEDRWLMAPTVRLSVCVCACVRSFTGRAHRGREHVGRGQGKGCTLTHTHRHRREYESMRGEWRAHVNLYEGESAEREMR